VKHAMNMDEGNGYMQTPHMGFWGLCEQTYTSLSTGKGGSAVLPMVPCRQVPGPRNPAPAPSIHAVPKAAH
jgi:hypothetical protein